MSNIGSIGFERMQFIIIQKKEKFKDIHIDQGYLNSNNAPSLISQRNHKLEISNFIAHVYLYDQIDNEKENYSYYNDDNKLLIVNGILNVDKNIRDSNIKNLFQSLNDKSEILGDYQLISIDKKGNGFLKTPKFNLKQLFYYYDEYCAILSTEIKLIVDSVQKIKAKKFVENYDIDFINDSIDNEWKERKFPKHTIFKNIKRIYPHEEVYFKNGKIEVKECSNIKVPQEFREKFYNNREQLYDEYYLELIKFIGQNLERLKSNISQIRLGLSGGFDSRLAVSILYKLCNEYEIPFKCLTIGIEDHPDVVIAKKITETLKIDHDLSIPQSGQGIYPQKVNEYMNTFYHAKGDFNSNDFNPRNREIDNLKTIHHSGMDAFKRTNMNSIYSGNRWFARRTLFISNFFLPLFYTEKEIFFALLYEENGDYREFVYEILKRSEPKLLEIPIVGDSIPGTNIKPYSTTSESKFHEKIPFLWDYFLVKNNLMPLLKKNLNEKIGFKGKILLKLVGLNELDYFINPKIDKIFNLYRKNRFTLKKTVKKLLKEKISNIYPKEKVMINMEKNDKNRDAKRKMVILMDFSSVANMHSFHQIEKIIFDNNTK